MSDQRHLVKDLVGQVGRRLFGSCAYCGQPCTGRVCRAHSDLPALDEGNGRPLDTKETSGPTTRSRR